MEEIMLDETESVPMKGTTSRRSSILKQRTPLQVIEPNTRKVSFSVKQTKEFHTTEAPFVLGSSYEETFQSDSPKSTHESHFTMKMVHSATDTYSNRSNEENMIFWQEELLNTTHFLSVDHFESSKTECEARMSIDIQAETQHCGLGIEQITQRSGQGIINWNEQTENVENLTPEVLTHLMEKQKIQTSQILYQPGNKSLLDHETKTASNTKANVCQHHSSQTFIECSFPSSHTIRNEGMWNSELMPYVLNRSESNKFSRGASAVNGNNSTKWTQLDKDTDHINNNKILMDAEMDFTDVIHINKTSSGSYTSHVNNPMDLTKGIFCRGTSSDYDEAQGYGNLDESEIEFTNTVGHIAASESEDTLSKISGIEMLECDSDSISDSANIQKAATKYMHKINAHHLHPSNAAAQSTAKLASAVDSNKIHTMAATTLEEKKYILEKSDSFQMHLCKKKKEDLNDRTLKFANDCHTEFIDATMEDISRTNKMNENNSKSVTNISNASCTELTNASWQKLATEISQVGQMESMNVKGYKSAVKISDDRQLELTDVIRCNSPTKNIDDSQLELTNVTVCKPILLADNISSNIQINNDPANDSQLEFTDMINCKSIAKVSNNYMELTNAAGFKTPVKVTHDSDQELTEVGNYGVDTNLYGINLERTNINSGKLNSIEEIECGNTHIIHKNLTEDTNLKSVPEVSDNRQEQSSKLVSHNPLADAVSGVWMEFTSVAAYKPAEIAFSKEIHCHATEQTEESRLELSGLKSSDSSLEFTKIVKQKSFVEDSNNSRLEFTNITGQNQLTKGTESSQQKITNLVQNLHAKDSDDNQLEFTNIAGQKLLAKDTDVSQQGIVEINEQNLEFTNFAMQKLPTKASDYSQLEFTNNIEQKLPADDFDNSRLEFTNTVNQKLAAEDKNISQLELTDIISQKLSTKYSNVSQLEFTNLTMQKLSTKDFDDSQLEFTNITRQKLSEKDSDNSQMVFTNSTMQKPLAKDSDDSQLEFTNSAKHKLAAKHIDVSQLEFTNIAGQKLLTEDNGTSQLDITSITMQKLYAKDSDGSHLKFINTRQKLQVKNSDDSRLEFTNNTNNTPFAKDCDSQLEITNIITKTLPAKVSDDSQKLSKDDSDDSMNSTNKTRQKLPAKDFDDSELQFTNITRHRPPGKYSNDSQLEFTNFTRHNTSTKDSNGSQLEFTGTAGFIPSIKNSDVELEFTTCKPTTNVSDVNNCSKEIEAIHLERTLDFLKIPNELKLKAVPLKENEVEGNCDQIDSEKLSPSAIRFEPASEICDESYINRRETVDSTNNPSVDAVLVINSDVSKKMLSHKKVDTTNESISPYRSQLELTEIAPLKPTANISTNLICSKTTGEMDQFSSRVTDGSQLEFTNVVGIKPVAESCESKTVIIESTVIMDITNAIQCRKNPKSEMELADTESDPEYSAKCSYVERGKNAGRPVDITELGSSMSASRKRNINDLNHDHSNDCELECSNMKYFRSAERADAQPTIGAKIERSETTSCKSFNERHLELAAITELKKASPQHTDVMIPHHASDSHIDVTNTVSCGTIKNSSICTPLADGVPSMNLEDRRNSDSMELTNKQSYVSQMPDSLEFTACIKYVNDVSKDNLLQEKSQLLTHRKGLETDNSVQEISLGSNVPQCNATANPYEDDFTHVIAVTDPKLSHKKKEVVRNDAYRATNLPLTSNSKQKCVQKRVQAAQNLLGVTIESDEAFMFDTCTGTFTGTFMPVNKLQMNKKFKYVFKTHSDPSSPEGIQLDTDSENAIYKIKEGIKENQKQNIEHLQTKDINLHNEPEHILLLENESIKLNDEFSYNFERADKADDSLMKIILDADRSLFSSLSTASPAAVLSSSSEFLVTPNAKEYLVEEVHPNLEKNKESMPSSEPEMMTEVEGNFTDGQLSKIQVLKQSSGMSETKTEMCNISVDMDLLSVADKDETSVKQAEVFTFFSNNKGETKEKVADIEASGKEKETVQLPNITLAHMELDCRESVFQGNTEQLKAAVALNVGQSCVAMIQKPLSLEEWLSSGKHEWDVKELSDTQWSFLFLYKSLGLVLKLDAASIKDGMMYISDILLESYLAKKSAPETHFVHHVLLKKLSPQNLKTKFKVTADVPELMNIISEAVAEMKLFLKDFFFMETCKLMEMKDHRVSFKMSDMHIHSVFRISVDLNNWEHIKPEDVTVEDLMGTINKEEVQRLVNAAPKGPTFLSEYVDIIREYISVLRKK